MKKQIVAALLALLCAVFCGCESTPVPPQTERTAPETSLEAAVETPATEAPATVPRVPGPERIEGRSAVIEQVSVEFADTLPPEITGSSTYSACDFKEKFVLDPSQQYALIRFTVTNQTEKEMKIADIRDEFLVELIYDNRYIFTPNSSSWCFFQAGGQVAAVSEMASVGLCTLDPLSTKDVAVYIPCSRAISEHPENYLIVLFSSTHSGFEIFEFIIR